MNNSATITRAQQNFLRACIASPDFLPVQGCPSPVIFRRWMRRATFRRALKSLRDALRFQADLHLTSAAASAAKALHQCVGSAPADSKAHKEQIQSLTTLLRIAHVRERFTSAVERPEPTTPTSSQRQMILAYLRYFAPEVPVRDVQETLKASEKREREFGASNRACA